MDDNRNQAIVIPDLLVHIRHLTLTFDINSRNINGAKGCESKLYFISRRKFRIRR